jgi:hypothetical protein
MKVAILALASAGTLIALLEYAVKVWAEARLQLSAASEVDTRMSKLFVELMWLAEGRSGSQVSERCVDKLVEDKVITKKDFDDLATLKEKLGACVVTHPVGKATQDAAIVSVGVLGRRYRRILGKPAKEALEGLKVFKGPEAERALELLADKE